MQKNRTFEDLGVSEKEAEKLKHSPVVIIAIDSEEVKDSKSLKLVCQVEHPALTEGKTLKISGAKSENTKGKLEISGLWMSLEKDGKLMKNSNLAKFLKFLKCEKIKDLVGKECMTTENEEGYLVFKAY